MNIESIEQIKQAKDQGNLMVLLIDHHEHLNNREWRFKSNSLSSEIIDRFEHSFDSTLIVFYKGYYKLEDIVLIYEELEDLLIKAKSLEYLNSFGGGVNLHSCMYDITNKLQDKLDDIVKTYGEVIDYQDLNELVTALT